MTKTNNDRLQLGCGLVTPSDWVNLDGSWNARLAKYPFIIKSLKALRIVPASQLNLSWNRQVFIHDVRKPLPFSDETFQAVYASHLLEHLYLVEAKRLLKECWRVLKPGGVLRVVVPDLQAIVEEYMNVASPDEKSQNKLMSNRADRLNQRLLFRRPEPPGGSLLYRLYTALYDFHSHKWMYDSESLIMHFDWAGFIETQEMPLHQSRITGIEQVEQPERVADGAGVCIEGIRP